MGTAQNTANDTLHASRDMECLFDSLHSNKKLTKAHRIRVAFIVVAYHCSLRQKLYPKIQNEAEHAPRHRLVHALLLRLPYRVRPYPRHRHFKFNKVGNKIIAKTTITISH